MGTVEKVGARSTEIVTLDRVTIIIPNSRFLENEVVNWSHGNAVSRLHLPVGVAYGSDIALVKKALIEAIRRHPEVLVRPKPEVYFQRFGDSALHFEVMVWTGEPRKQFKVKSDLNYEIEASLRRYGITIPFPQRDLHVRSPQLDELVNLLQQSGVEPNSMPQPGLPQPGLPQPGLLQSNLPQSDLSQSDLSQSDLSQSDLSQSGHASMSAMANELPSSTLPSTSTDVKVTVAQPIPHSTASASTSVSPSPTSPDQDTEPLQISADLDLETLSTQMQGDQGLDICDRSYNGHIYPACFTGTNLVEWLVQRCDYTREDAVLIGQWLMQQGFIHSAADSNQRFEDGYHFYQFYRDQRSPQTV